MQASPINNDINSNTDIIYFIVQFLSLYIFHVSLNVFLYGI